MMTSPPTVTLPNPSQMVKNFNWDGFDKISEGVDEIFSQAAPRRNMDIYETPVMSLEDPQGKEYIFILYHAPCKDGFGAAWSHAQSVLRGKAKKNVVYVYVPETHKFAQTELLSKREDISELTIYYLDICPKRDQLTKLHELAKEVRVWDHHPTAQRDCGDLPYCFFDLNRSGAGIAWDTFVKEPRPLLIKCIEDGDLWRWKVPNSSPILTVLETRRFDFKIWTEFANELERDPTEIIKLGKAYAEYRGMVQRMMTGRKVHKLTIGGVTMPAVNGSIFQSGVGNILANKPGPCGAVYYFNGTYWAFSLRSTDKGPDVSLIAEKYGGGGHRNASGFRIDRIEDLSTIFNTIEQYTNDELDTYFGTDDLDYVPTLHLST